MFEAALHSSLCRTDVYLVAISRTNIGINAFLVKNRLVTSISRMVIHHCTHRADILRLEILLRFVRIYLDTYLFGLRPFESLLNISNVAVGYDHRRREFLGDVVMPVKKNTTFLRRIFDGWQNYGATCFICNSLILRGKLAKTYSRKAHVCLTSLSSVHNVGRQMILYKPKLSTVLRITRRIFGLDRSMQASIN